MVNPTEGKLLVWHSTRANDLGQLYFCGQLDLKKKKKKEAFGTSQV